MLSLLMGIGIRETKPALADFDAAIRSRKRLDGLQFPVLPAALDELQYKDAKTISPGADGQAERRRCLAFAISRMNDD